MYHCLWTLGISEYFKYMMVHIYTCTCMYLQEAEDQPVRVIGNILTMAERVDDEFTKLLQNTDAHSTDYVTKYILQFVQY